MENISQRLSFLDVSLNHTPYDFSILQTSQNQTANNETKNIQKKKKCDTSNINLDISYDGDCSVQCFECSKRDEKTPMRAVDGMNLILKKTVPLIFVIHFDAQRALFVCFFRLQNLPL